MRPRSLASGRVALFCAGIQRSWTGCGAFAQSCPQIITLTGPDPFYASPAIRGQNIQTSARLDLERSNAGAYYAAFLAPPGYTTCKAKIDVRHGAMAGDAAFKGIIRRTSDRLGNGVAVEARAPTNRPPGQWIGYQIYVEFVRKEKLAQVDCWPENTTIWQCEGQTCTFYPNGRY